MAKYGNFTDRELDELYDATNVINHYVPKIDTVEGDEEDGWSVLVTDKKGSGYSFWVDAWLDSYGDLNLDWNEYIFSTINSKDMLAKMMQEYLADDIFEEVDSYLYSKVIKD